MNQTHIHVTYRAGTDLTNTEVIDIWMYVSICNILRSDGSTVIKTTERVSICLVE